MAGFQQHRGNGEPGLPVSVRDAVEASGFDLDGTDARRALLDLATDAAGIGTFDWDLDTGVLAWDERLLRLFGYDSTGFDKTIEGFNARLHPEDLQRVTQVLQHAIDSCGDYEVEYRIVLPVGEERWVAARGRALCDEQGRTVRVLGAAWDITTRREAQDRIATILEGMTVGFIAMDTGWVMTHVNAEGERITGFPRSEMLGRTMWDKFPATVGTEFEANYRRAAETGESVTFDAYYPEPLDVWVEVRAVPTADGVSLYFLDITARRAVEERSATASARERLLGQVIEELAGTLDPEEAVTRLARLAVPTLADWSIVTLIDDDREAGSVRGLRSAGSWHVDAAMRPLADAYAQGRLPALRDDALVVRALISGQVQVLEAATGGDPQSMISPGPIRELIATLAPTSVAVLPLPGRTGPVGLLSLCNGPGRGRFTADILDLARQMAARAGLALDNARLYRQQRDLAEGLQRSLLTPPPERAHVEVAVRYVPAAQAAQVGGDWYDVFLQLDGTTVLVIGDVIGHDTQAAAAMSQIRTIVRTVGAQGDDAPADILRTADQVMQTLQVGTAATAIVARLEQTPEEVAQGITRLRWSNAGHPPPMAINPDGTVLLLSAPTTDLLLGVRPGTDRRESEIVLERDAVVLLYTDGLVERRDQPLDVGLGRLQQALGALTGRPLDELCDELLARMLPAEADDDVAIVAVRLHPQDRPAVVPRSG